MAAIICNVCNIRRAKTGSKGAETSPFNDMCNYCYEEGAHENAHSDNNHEAIAAGTITLQGTTFTAQEELDKWLADEQGIMDTCWICHPELNLAKQPVKKGNTGAKTQGARRPQLNHKGHAHPQTPAARKACKVAFWIAMAKEGVTPANVKADHFIVWDHKCDGHGHVIQEPVKKTTKMTVVPRGPKGGVINQMKANKPS
jgi:hypothetical protein